MMQKKIIKKPKLNNDGAALVTVIIIVMFVSIIATILLYMTFSNFSMKVTDQHVKESFYGAENAVETIRAELMEIASESAESAYYEVLKNYARYDSATRASTFQTLYFNGIKERWTVLTGCNPVIGASSQPALQNMVNLLGTGYLIKIESGYGDITVGSDARALLKDIVVEYTDSRGYFSRIKTDFVIVVPEYEWGVSTAKQTLDSGDDVTAPRIPADITSCVYYSNWSKE